MCLQSAEGSGQTASIAEGINEGDEGEAETTSADTEVLMSPSRRITEDSVVSSMLGEASSAVPSLCCSAVAGQLLPKVMVKDTVRLALMIKKCQRTCVVVRRAALWC